jgi:hypothetical protein
MSSRRFLSWPAGWRKSLPSSILVGVFVGTLVVAAQGLSSGWNQIDWCGSAVILFFVVVAVTALSARVRPDPSQPGQGKGSGD